ncbi:MAG: hypothetical protein OQJ98_01950 [Candidatus Pacebacteria bacterium]|nr:hypothetical protein [Candidatus Paceibacterota bacterium]
MQDPIEYSIQSGEEQVPHYHGDVVRILFLVGGVIILATLPFYKNLLPVGTSFLTVFVVLLALGGAIVNPFQRWTVFVDLVISAVAVVLFEYAAVIRYGYDEGLLSLIRQLLAIVFLFALYYSGRTLRAMVMHQIKQSGD